MKMEIGHSNSKPGNWLFGKWIDLGLLFIPLWILWILFFSNSSYFESTSLPVWAWVVFIVGLDVGHVWSSLFRTYMVKDEFNSHKKLLIIAPILAVVLSICLLTISITVFWRVMAYLAVFHFIKQQYGFVALYKLKAKENRKQLIKDKWMVYIATIYPVIYWHFNSNSSFNWFVQNDFLPIHEWVQNESVLQIVFMICNSVYWGLMLLWLIQEIRASNKYKVSIGKILWVLTTAINWWFAIVYFNSDLVFSISNVVAHGIPYLVLIYYYRVKKEEVIEKASTTVGWRLKWLFILVFTILIIAFVEEYFWDMFIYREHGYFFEAVYPYHWDQLGNNWIFSLVVTLLALPQQVHYIIDGFIWKMNAKNVYLKPIFKPTDES